MASIMQFIAAAEDAGFVATTCVHEDAQHHLVFDYPEPLHEGWHGPFWRVHVNRAKVPHVTYISGDKGAVDKRATLIEAINFVKDVARRHPKDTPKK